MSANFNSSSTCYVSCLTSSVVDNIFAGGGTIMTWFKSSTYGISATKVGGLIVKTPSVGGQGGWQFYADGPGLSSPKNAFYFIHFTTAGASPSVQWTTPANSFFIDILYHVAVTFNKDDINNNAIIYVNGVAPTITRLAAGTTAYASDAANNLEFGNVRAFSDNLGGWMEDVRVYDRILSADEIKTVYYAKGGDSLLTGLKGRWLLREGPPAQTASGNNSMKDTSGFGTHATPTGSVVYDVGVVSSRRKIV